MGGHGYIVLFYHLQVILRTDEEGVYNGFKARYIFYKRGSVYGGRYDPISLSICLSVCLPVCLSLSPFLLIHMIESGKNLRKNLSSKRSNMNSNKKKKRCNK